MYPDLRRTQRLTFSRITRFRLFEWERMERARARAAKIYDVMFLTLLGLLAIALTLLIVLPKR